MNALLWLWLLLLLYLCHGLPRTHNFKSSLRKTITYWPFCCFFFISFFNCRFWLLQRIVSEKQQQQQQQRRPRRVRLARFLSAWEDKTKVWIQAWCSVTSRNQIGNNNPQKLYHVLGAGKIVNVLPFKPGVGQNIALHAWPTAWNASLFSPVRSSAAVVQDSGRLSAAMRCTIASRTHTAMATLHWGRGSLWPPDPVMWQQGCLRTAVTAGRCL